MRKKNLLFGVLALLFALPAIAQDDNNLHDGKIHYGTTVSVGVLNGVKIEGSARFMPELTARAGFAFIPSMAIVNNKVFVPDDPQELEAYQSALGYTPGIRGNLKVSSFSGHVLADYHPFKNAFRVTAGLYFNRPQINAKVQLINQNTGQSIMNDQSTLNPNNMPVITIKDKDNPADKVSIQPSSTAEVEASVDLGRTVQPYIGIGYGFAVPVSRVSFFADLGMLFSGKAQISSPNVITGDPNLLIDFSEDAQEAVYLTQILPVLNIGVSIRLF